ncbi:MAG: depupylase/deamidase Dop [Corynebacterium sp.]|nr:depupylase/deamidase Dop [Corynebacterium sp.]
MVRTLIGTEIEFGISSPQQPDLSPIITSTHAVLGYAPYGTPWDYAGESPLRDSRGFDLRRYHTAPIVDPQAVGMANLVLTNGARLYVDHAHPEYSSPETTNAYMATLYELAGSQIMHQATLEVARLTEAGESAVQGQKPCPPLNIYKNNVDGKGASYGAHENYLYPRSLAFDLLAKALIPFFVARQVVVGAGRVGIGQASEEAGFQISQRADYIEQQISLETTLNRGIINTRDEPHMDASTWGRLHVIVGDANMSQTSIFLKLGMTDLVIRALIAKGEKSPLLNLELVDPVSAIHLFSHDLTLTHTVATTDGRELTALDILDIYRAEVGVYLGNPSLAGYGYGEPENCFIKGTTNPYAASQEDVDRSLLALWDEAIQCLRADIRSARHLLDWVAKLCLMEGYVAKGKSWDSATIALVDLQYADINPARSLYTALVTRGRMRELTTPREEFIHTPPRDTRAWLRGSAVQYLRPYVRAVNWDRITLGVPDGMGVVSPEDAITILMNTPESCTFNVDAVNALTEIQQLAIDQNALFARAKAITDVNYSHAYENGPAGNSEFPADLLRSRSELSQEEYGRIALLFQKLKEEHS